ncbi:MAG: hypothetical protein AB1765_06215 [Candidatus Hydrogenedentota bacterium]
MTITNAKDATIRSKIQNVVKQLVEKYSPHKIILFGSMADKAEQL